MNIDQYESRMILALEGDLAKTEYDLLMQEIKANVELTTIWESYRDLYEDMDMVPLDVPSEKIKDRFYDWLEETSNEKSKIIDIAPAGIKKGPFIIWRKWVRVAAVLVCVFGFWSLYENNRNVESTLADMSNKMEELMTQQSSTDRIKAIRVNYNNNTTDVDDKMIQVLIDVLYKDQSSNVRLAAVETLANYMGQDIVREALIKRLQEEKDGGVKLSIITSLSQRQDENLKTTLENIVNDDSQEKFVIDEAHMQLIRFEKIDI